MKKTILLSALLCTFLVNSQTIFQENFATFITGANLSGQGTWSNNTANPGGMGACTGIACVGTRVQANSISYPNFGTSANSVEISGDRDATGRGFGAVESGDVYIAMVMNLTFASTTAAGDFFRVCSAGNFNTTFRLGVKNTGGGVQFGVQKGGSGTWVFSPNTYAFNQNHLLIFKYSISAATTSDDILNVFINPNFANGESAASVAISTNVGTDIAASIDRLSFRQNSTTNMPTGNAGLLSVAKTWATLGFAMANVAGFDKNIFAIFGNQTSKGILSVKSAIAAENAIVNIYNLNGALITSKKINIKADINDILISPLPTATPFIVEIVSENRRFSQKIISQ